MEEKSGLGGGGEKNELEGRGGKGWCGRIGKGDLGGGGRGGECEVGGKGAC